MKLSVISRVQTWFLDNEFLVFTPIYFFLSFIRLVAKIRATPSWTDGTLVQNHTQLMAFQYYNNEQSRLLQYLVPEFFHRVYGISVYNGYVLQRFLFVFLAFLVFHFFLRKWFSRSESFAGVLFLADAMPLTFMNDLQESAPLLMLLFILALWALRDQHDLLFTFFVWLGGGLTNETMLILPAAYFFYHLDWHAPKQIVRLIGKTLLIALPGFVTQGVIRYITRDRPHLGGAWHWPDNIEGILHDIQPNLFHMPRAYYLFPFFLFAAFWIYAAISYHSKPLFLKRISWIVPLFIAAHLITGKFNESRQMIPLGFILIPMGLFVIFPKSTPSEGPQEQVK